MKAKLSLTRSAALGAIAGVLIPLSACLAARNWSVQTRQIGNGPDLRIPVQPEEKVRLEGLRFKADGASLRRNSRAMLGAAAEILKSEPGKTVYVDAYCERARSKKANLRLAQQRAESVKAYLEGQGIPSERMIARGFGAENFAASNDSPRTRARNSRVELIPFTDHTASTNLAYSPSAAGSLN